MKALLMYRGGVRTVRKTLSDGVEHDLFYRARTPNELAAYFGTLSSISKEDTAESAVERQNLYASLIAESLCDAGGNPLLTLEEARLVPATLKVEICGFITTGSNEAGEAGKG